MSNVGYLESLAASVNIKKRLKSMYAMRKRKFVSMVVTKQSPPVRLQRIFG